MLVGCRKLSVARLIGSLVLLLGCTVATVSGQPGKPATNSESPRLSTLKLPDGAVIILARSLEDPNVPVDGVVLSTKEYDSLIDRLEQAKKLKDVVRPIIPSYCQIRGKIVNYGKQPVASLAITYKFVVTSSRGTVALGGARGFLRAVESSHKQVPVLQADKDGLVAIVDEPGEYTLTLTMDALITPRGPSGSIGFDLGLPRSPITKLQFARPNATAKEVVVGTRMLDRPGEISRNSYPVDRLSGTDGVPLGPTDLLELIWEVPPAPGTVTEIPREAETEVLVRIDELRFETQAKIRLKGTSKEWKLDLPRGAEVRIDRVELPPGADLAANLGFPLTAPVLVPPPDANSTLWTVKSPDIRVDRDGPDPANAAKSDEPGIPRAVSGGAVQRTGGAPDRNDPGQWAGYRANQFRTGADRSSTRTRSGCRSRIDGAVRVYRSSRPARSSRAGTDPGSTVVADSGYAGGRLSACRTDLPAEFYRARRASTGGRVATGWATFDHPDSD